MINAIHSLSYAFNPCHDTADTKGMKQGLHLNIAAVADGDVVGCAGVDCVVVYSVIALISCTSTGMITETLVKRLQ